MSSRRIAIFNTKPYDKEYFSHENKTAGYGMDLVYFEEKLTPATVPLVAQGFDAVVAFVNDTVDREVVEKLASYGIKLIALRCAGFDNVDCNAAKELGVTVTRVPAYSPYATSEHAIALIMTLNRKTHKAYNKTREGDFSLNGQLGFDMFGKTAGVIGTGKIGANTARILLGFGCNVIAHDIYEDENLKKAGVKYVSLDELYAQSDVISIHAPLLDSTRHMINETALAKMKTGVLLVNTSRGALMDTKAVIDALKKKKIGALGIDVYEHEKTLFFDNHSGEVIDDDIIERLLSFPNVIVTAHQAFFTREALVKISSSTLSSINKFLNGQEIDKENIVVKPQ
eukprot:GEZU01032578.1.p1 GENE.GEZU01032578.1~~GEZU01032578.1.p1  ORF type:complete len:341 (-),score=135.02 GEZU01032578.1:109-1131(-)